jgi:hypothetical protein
MNATMKTRSVKINKLTLTVSSINDTIAKYSANKWKIFPKIFAAVTAAYIGKDNRLNLVQGDSGELVNDYWGLRRAINTEFGTNGCYTGEDDPTHGETGHGHYCSADCIPVPISYPRARTKCRANRKAPQVERLARGGADPVGSWKRREAR